MKALSPARQLKSTPLTGNLPRESVWHVFNRSVSGTPGQTPEHGLALQAGAFSSCAPSRQGAPGHFFYPLFFGVGASSRSDLGGGIAYLPKRSFSPLSTSWPRSARRSDSGCSSPSRRGGGEVALMAAFSALALSGIAGNGPGFLRVLPFYLIRSE